MQTIQLQIEDKNIETFLTILNNLKTNLIKNLTISNATTENLTKKYQNSPQFTKDKIYFQSCLDDINNNKSKLLKENEYQTQITDFEEKLKSKYADN
ncbi:MAG: hypothetical protein DRQ51_01035 [Gammaproteobacteria bacterium]|nr:MAG: hypothetical protein DRQ51_01035 [Gammaproteobacteria bacterium]